MTFNLTQFLNYIPTGKAYVLFGNKLTHSISREIHNEIFSTYNIDGEYFYVELSKDQLPQAINHLKQYFCGANVTIPYKTDVIPFLDCIDDTSSRLNSVNTIKITDGKAYGFNTDILGVLDTLSTDNIDIHGKKVALLGYGGTTTVMADIFHSCEITIFGREMEKAENFAKRVRENHLDTSITCDLLDNFEDNFDIIINTTPIGMNELEHLSPINEIKTSQYIFDCIYNPLTTKCLNLAKTKNIKHRNGLLMLLRQALHAQKIWNNIDISQSNNMYEKFCLDVFLKRHKFKNIVIFGFMGCGKTVVSKELSKITGLTLFDTDHYIENKSGMTISNMFNQYGESYFRNLELETALKIADMENTIISVGGGFVLNPKVQEIISKNCILVFLDTPLENILKHLEFDNTRPLLKTSDISTLYNSRYEKYNSIKNISIQNGITPKDKAWEIIKNT